MNLLIEKGLVNEMSCGSNFAYVLNDNAIFSSTEYKVLQSQKNGCFIKCMKTLFNGKIQMYYLTDTYKPFTAMLSNLESDSFLTIIANLFADIIDVKNNGFLSCQNIDISLEKIFVDPSTYKVHLVYLPLGTRLFDDVSSFENELRTCLVKLISGLPALCATKTAQFLADLSNGTLKLEDLYSSIKGGVVNPAKLQNKDTGSVKLIALNSPKRVEIAVTKAEFVIGKNAAAVDGVVSFNKMISRVHCKINQSAGQVTITDLQSANGTYVNRVRLHPNQPKTIKNGDIVRLANSDFQVKFCKEG